MRAGPLGALYADRPELLADAIMQSSLITHADIRPTSLAYTVAWANLTLVNGKSPRQIRRELPVEVARVEREWLEGHRDWDIDRSGGHQVSEALKRLFERDYDSLDDIGRAVLKNAADISGQPITPSTSPNEPTVLIGGVYSLGAGLLSHDRPWEVLSHIARQGSDTDTICAITGGLLGSRYGTGWIPRDGILHGDRAREYAATLSGRGPLTETDDQFLTREAALTKRVQRYRDNLKASLPK